MLHTRHGTAKGCTATADLTFARVQHNKQTELSLVLKTKQLHEVFVATSNACMSRRTKNSTAASKVTWCC
jgi:hypothetical protein